MPSAFQGEEKIMKLSVIICVYNTDKTYLTECLSSIFSSTLSDYEVVFVDDGSTVDYSDLLEKYKVKYSKTENGGHFAARLHGIEISEGEYITFVDSDDTVSKNYHQPMVDAADKHGADIVINSWAFHTERTKRCCLYELSHKEKVFVEGGEVLPFFTSCRGRDHSYSVQWNKIYRKSTVLSAIAELSGTEIFKKRLTYAEDTLLSFFFFKHAGRVTSVNSGFYLYRIHSSQSVTAGNEEKLKTHIDCMCGVLNTMLAAIPSGENAKKMTEDISYWKGLMARTHYSISRSCGYSSLYPYIKEKYGVEKLSLSTLHDAKLYSKSELLGENFDDIDSALVSLFENDGNVTASYDRSSTYIPRIISSLSELYEKKIDYAKKNADVVIPKPKSRLTDSIIHNSFVYRVGMLLFPKGSKIRSFLKKHL